MQRGWVGWIMIGSLLREEGFGVVEVDNDDFRGFTWDVIRVPLLPPQKMLDG